MFPYASGKVLATNEWNAFNRKNLTLLFVYSNNLLLLGGIFCLPFASLSLSATKHTYMCNTCSLMHLCDSDVNIDAYNTAVIR